MHGNAGSAPTTTPSKSRPIERDMPIAIFIFLVTLLVGIPVFI